MQTKPYLAVHLLCLVADVTLAVADLSLVRHL
jgi:hypothetical protein